MGTLQKLKNLGFQVSGIEESVEMIEKEIPNPEKRRAGRYPQKGWTPTIKVMVPKSTGGGENVTLTGPVSAFESLYLSKSDMALHCNKDIFSRLSEQSSSFCGGTHADLKRAFAGQSDMTLADQAKRELEQSDFAERLHSELSVMFPKRRRVFGDEGQWVEQRRWDGDAFEDFRKEANPTPSFNIRAIAGENCHVSAEKLSRFGAMVWALCDILEGYGVRVSLELAYDNSNCWSKNKTLKISIPVKAFGEYLSPSFMVGMVHPNFFRRAVFAGIIASADAAGAEVFPGLGRSMDGDAVLFQDGTLTLRSSGLNDKKRVIETTLTALAAATSN